ncbi:MAG TPA: HPr(Ser) kinase/phosphatase [Elusimicrobiota bacterium]|nr:HPr(Ser) kinase/phosphatase [Elusimicrobiota bacterium]
MSFTVGDLFREQGRALRLRLTSGSRGMNRAIAVSELNRPGLALGGFLDHFRAERIQIIGQGERAYCLKAPRQSLARSLSAMLSCPGIPGLVLTHGKKAPRALAEACRRHGVPLFCSALDTASLVDDLSDVLESRLAPAAVIHGVLVDVYGLGVLIQGDAGTGKSECAVELLKRGHILIADDVVQVQRRRGGILQGTCPEALKHHMEVRGLGLIDVGLLFGVGAALDRSRIELSVRLEPWEKASGLDRLGLDREETRILDVPVPLLRLPVSPGRNLAILIEIAALNERLKRQGYFAAQAFNRRLIQKTRAKAK